MSFKIKKALACKGYYDVMVNGISIFRGTHDECKTTTQRMIVKRLLVS